MDWDGLGDVGVFLDEICAFWRFVLERKHRVTVLREWR
jgi:hypothetical protein